MLTLYRRHRTADGRLDLKPGERIPDEKGEPIKLDGKGRETGRATLTLMDWDGDGKLDLIVSNAIESFDGLRWYREYRDARKMGAGAAAEPRAQPAVEPLSIARPHRLGRGRQNGPDRRQRRRVALFL